jgi:transcriptional regulator with XRE-family HTH domain
MAKERRDGPSDQLKRFRDVVVQIEQGGHPAWDDEFNKRPTQAGIARRTKFKPAYLSALLGRGQTRHSDIGAEKLALFASGVGVDIRYFFVKYERELPFRDWLVSASRGEPQGASATGKAHADTAAQLRAEFRNELAKQARQQTRELAALRSEMKKAKRSS